jgi:hypothetical protein
MTSKATKQHREHLARISEEGAAAARVGASYVFGNPYSDILEFNAWRNGYRAEQRAQEVKLEAKRADAEMQEEFEKRLRRALEGGILDDFIGRKA